MQKKLPKPLIVRGLLQNNDLAQNIPGSKRRGSYGDDTERNDYLKKLNLKDFAMHFCRSRNAAESAIAVGVSPLKAKLEGLRMLSRKQTISAVKAYAEQTVPLAESEIISGLERLAFGRTNDAAALVFAEEITPYRIEHADLFNVSEIKKIKGGGVEIKFFDRQKALEKLAEYTQKQQSAKQAKTLVDAICSQPDKDISSDSPGEAD